MIKIDYEGCWKEAKQTIEDNGYLYRHDISAIEKNNTRDFIELKRREPKDQIDYIMQKYTENYIELIKYKKAWNELFKTAFIPDDAYKIKLIEQKYITK